MPVEISAERSAVYTGYQSPELSKKAFWCIDETQRDAGFSFTYPYHINIPSFGDWGFIMAKKRPGFNDQLRSDIDYKFLESSIYDHILYFSKDIRDVDVQVNHLDKPVILEYYLDHWQSLQGKKK